MALPRQLIRNDRVFKAYTTQGVLPFPLLLRILILRMLTFPLSLRVAKFRNTFAASHANFGRMRMLIYHEESINRPAGEMGFGDDAIDLNLAEIALALNRFDFTNSHLCRQIFSPFVCSLRSFGRVQ
eukprot:scaffold1425_cov111-Skeletonema_dohrnii-CCMP3373.AAC.2